MKEDRKVIVSEHVLEVRHQATGRFLDVRGYVADHIKGADIFPHWEIDTNVVNFRDAPKKAEKMGAFAGFKSAGVFVKIFGDRPRFSEYLGTDHVFLLRFYYSTVSRGGGMPVNKGPRLFDSLKIRNRQLETVSPFNFTKM